MDAHRYEQLKNLIAGALALPRGQQQAYVRRHGGGDHDLVREALELLAHDPGDEPLDLEVDPAIASPFHDMVGQSIGPYQLVRVIGEGGMGIVFLAEQVRPLVRQVALKIIKVGMDTREVVARFESERQALALMNHPNIARVIDAGATTEGRPFFVMEYIEGVPITRYCQEQALGLEDRLRLVAQVCRGIHHAHQRGVIHRDIKPSNILVTSEDGRPTARVIDFGIAKAIDQRLTDHTVLTRLGFLLGTPEYMSPEQADLGSRDIDTRSDVYALGVLLYELLTGSLPVAKQDLLQAGLAGMHRAIADQDPEPPSARTTTLGRQPDNKGTFPTAARTWSARLRGDLDWVTLKALDRDRERRYDSPGALADELDRFLANQPVEAGPPSRWYRARKFARRYRVVVTAAAVVLATLLIGMAGVTTGMVRANRAEQRALMAARQAEAGRLFQLARNAELPLQAQAALLKAIELDDRPEYRRRVRRHLLQEPPLFRLPHAPDSHNAVHISFSPDGRWLAVGWSKRGSLQLFQLPDGEPIQLRGHTGALSFARFTADSRFLVTSANDSTLRIWSPEAATEVDRWRLQGDPLPFLCCGDSLLVVGEVRADVRPRWWARPLTGGAPRLLGSAGDTTANHVTMKTPGVDPTGRWLAMPHDDHLQIFDLHDLERGPVRTLGRHPGVVHGALFTPRGDQVLSIDADGLLRLWDLEGNQDGPVRSFVSGPNPYLLSFSRDQRYLLASSTDGYHVWDLTWNTAALPRVLRGSRAWSFDADFHPSQPWLVTSHTTAMVAAWNLTSWNRIDLALPAGDQAAMRFSVDGRWLVTASDAGVVTAWPLSGLTIGEPRQLGIFPQYRFVDVRLDDAGRRCFLTPCNCYDGIGTLTSIALDGGPARVWTGATCTHQISADGRLAAFSADEALAVHHARIMELDDGSSRELTEPDGGATAAVGFLADNRLVAHGAAGLGVWEADGGGFVRLADPPIWARLARDRRTLVYLDQDHRLWRQPADSTGRVELTSHPILSTFYTVYLDSSGSRLVGSTLDEELVFADLDRGFVQRLPIGRQTIETVAIDPRGRWIAAAHAGMVTLLPVPTDPLPMDLPHDQYLAWLRSLTNLRLVEDPDSDTGYELVGRNVPDWSHPPRW
jgi:serine/threonine protein kinase